MNNQSDRQLDELLGGDLRLDYGSSSGFYEDADLRQAISDNRAQRDLVASTGVDTLRQAIVNRLKTHQGELTPLGHPHYGSRHHELIGQPNVERTRNLIKLYVLQALKQEKRIVSVLDAKVSTDTTPPREQVRIDITVEIINQPLPLTIIVPFSLRGDVL